MDSRTKYQKIRALIDHPSTHPEIRKRAQEIFNRTFSNSEIAINPTCEEAWRRYTEAYTTTIPVRIGTTIFQKVVKPEAIPNRRQMKVIFAQHADWASILAAMRRCVGCIGNEVPTEDEYLRKWEQEVANG